MQKFSAYYHVVVTKYVGYVSAVADRGRWVEFSHFEAYVAFTTGRKIPCYAAETVFFSHEVFLRCRTALAVIRVELAPESNNVCKVASVSFSEGAEDSLSVSISDSLIFLTPLLGDFYFLCLFVVFYRL